MHQDLQRLADRARAVPAPAAAGTMICHIIES
jgi:hypothetical protein